MIGYNTVEDKKPEEILAVKSWLLKKSKHFRQMPGDCVEALAKLVFLPPVSQGAGIFKRGKPIIMRGLRPKVIYIVFDGTVRRCSILKDEDYRFKREENSNPRFRRNDSGFRRQVTMTFSPKDNKAINDDLNPMKAQPTASSPRELITPSQN